MGRCFRGAEAGGGAFSRLVGRASSCSSAPILSARSMMRGKWWPRPYRTRSASTARWMKLPPLTVVSVLRACVYSQWWLLHSSRSERTKTARTWSSHADAAMSLAEEVITRLRPSRPPCMSTNERKSCHIVESPANSSCLPRRLAQLPSTVNGCSQHRLGCHSYSCRWEVATSSQRP